MSETLDPEVNYSASQAASDRDAIVMSPSYEGPAAWHDYSVERGNEKSTGGFTGAGGYWQANWNVRGLWRG